MPTIETVNIEDVYPLQDEYGNNLARRDYSLKANQEYVKELARSMQTNGGKPDELVTLVRDGGIYRIKAGNSRIEAMKLLGTKSFDAIVEDENTLQSAIAAVIRTNTKKKYEALEESRFVQQYTLFEVSDEVVADVANIPVEQVKKVRKAKEVVDEVASYDMSLFRLAAIGEFADDPEAVEALTNCTEREYQAIAERFRSKRKRNAAEDELLQAIQAHGIDVVADAKGMNLVRTIQKPGDIPDELPEGTVATKHSVPGFYMLMQPAKPAEVVNDEREQGRADFEAMRYRQREGARRRAAWVASKFPTLGALSPLKSLCSLVRDNPSRFSAPAKSFMQLAGIEDMPVGATEIAARFMDLNGDCILDIHGKPRKAACTSYINLLDALEQDGYEPDEDEQQIYQTAHDSLEG